MLIAIGLLLLAIAYLLNLGILVYAIYALLAVFFVSHFFSTGWINGLVGKRRVGQTEAEIGERISIVVDVRHTGRLPVSWVLLEDMLSRRDTATKGQRLVVSGRHMEVTDFKPGQAFKLIYQLKCNHRGYYQIGPLVAESGDLFGLNRRYRVLLEPEFLQVNPKIIPLEGYDIASRRPIGEIVMTHRLFEDPTRIAGVRQYQSGDPLARIHWRATARTGQLQSKIYDASSMAGATVILDFHQSSFDPRHEPVRSELAVTCAASIANAVNQMGQQIGLISNGRDAADRIRLEGWRSDRRTRAEARKSSSMSETSDRLRPVIVPTKKADDQMQQILSTLARLEMTDGLSLFQLVQESQERLPRDASVIAVLTHVDLEVGVTLGQLRRMGYAVVAIINCHDVERFTQLSEPLLSEGIETRHLSDESAVRSICEKQILLR